CAVSTIGLATRSVSEAQAAHVVPLGRGGADEPRNGLTLTSTLHWAFDRGLFSISDERRVIVPVRVRSISSNDWLIQFHDRAIVEARTSSLRTASDAFEWHRQNVMSQ